MMLRQRNVESKIQGFRLDLGWNWWFSLRFGLKLMVYSTTTLLKNLDH